MEKYILGKRYSQRNREGYISGTMENGKDMMNQWNIMYERNYTWLNIHGIYFLLVEGRHSIISTHKSWHSARLRRCPPPFPESRPSLTHTRTTEASPRSSPISHSSSTASNPSIHPSIRHGSCKVTAEKVLPLLNSAGLHVASRLKIKLLCMVYKLKLSRVCPLPVLQSWNTLCSSLSMLRSLFHALYKLSSFIGTYFLPILPRTPNLSTWGALSHC